MKWRVLISAPYIQPVLESFRFMFENNYVELVVPKVNERLSEEELLVLIEDIDGVICGDDRFTEKVLMSAPKLKVISKWGTGVDSIDKETCNRLGITIFNTPNAFSEPVADSVLGYILCFARKLPWMDSDLKSGIWDKIPGVALGESVLGVIGVGNVGKAVIRRAVAFGMTVVGNDIVEVNTEFIKETGLELVGKEHLLSVSDFVSINCDLNSTSYHLVGDNEFARMKNTAYIINTARGSIIDETSLINALEGKLIAGAALDVFENEPLPEDSLLLSMDNVILAPHNANSSPSAWEKVHQNTITNLLKGLKS